MGLFDDEYRKLNKAQKQAVDLIDGAVLVIAGPGTGKTQLLGMRVANILKRTDVSPQNILCLTFTNKASDNMQQRLLRLIGPEANGVVVKTFHGFAAEIMNRYPEHFWNGARLSIAPDPLQLEIAHRILARLPHEHPLALKFAGHFTLVGDVQTAINLVKEAGLTPAKLRAVIRANLAYIDQIEPELAKCGALRVSAKTIPLIEDIVQKLPGQNIESLVRPLRSLDVVIKESLRSAVERTEIEGNNLAVSQWKRRWLQPLDGSYTMAAERQRNTWWLGLADAYEAYRQQMHGRSYYDYADMLVEVISQLENNPGLKADVQEQFQYVLIDEFQDTNAAQLRLSHLVSDHFASGGNPNIMAVGDDDQSIFKFQGAELSNMNDFRRSYPSAKIIVLTQNYRSTQSILDTASSIIEHASYRLVNELSDLDKKLTAENNYAKSQVEHFSYRSRPEQLDGMARVVAKLLAKGNSVAVLARGHASLRDMAGQLIELGIPLRYEQSNNVFEKPAIGQLMILLRTIEAIMRGDRAVASRLLSQTLRHPMWKLDPVTLWKFAMAQPPTDDWFGSLMLNKEQKLRAIGVWLQEMVELSSAEPAQIIIEYLIGLRPSKAINGPIKAYYLEHSELSQEYLETLSAVHLLRVLAAEFTGQRQARLSDFVSMIDLMERSGRVLADSTPFQNGEMAVELLSVHKAKGLEFDCVLVIDAVQPEWNPKARGRIPPANLPLRQAEDDNDDYARLMYVAATRARHTLVASSYKQSIKGEPVSSTPLINALAPQIVKHAAGKQLINTLETGLRWPRLIHKDQKQMLRSRLETYSMSVTHLLNFLDVSTGGPEHFFERNVLRLPDVKSPSLSLGTAIHDSLQLAQNLVNQDKFNASKIIKQFENSLELEGLPKADFARQKTRGKNILHHLFNDLNFKLDKGAKAEYAIKGVSCGQAILNGKLDSVKQDESSLLIGDYKTGRPLVSLNAKSGAQAIKAWRHRLQLTYYALLAQLDPNLTKHSTTTCQMIYVEASKSKDLIRSYIPTPNEITRLGTIIQKVWDHIMRLDFPDTSNYDKTMLGIEQFEEDLLSGKI